MLVYWGGGNRFGHCGLWIENVEDCWILLTCEDGAGGSAKIYMLVVVVNRHTIFYISLQGLQA